MGKWVKDGFDSVVRDDTHNGTKIPAVEYMRSGACPIIDQGQDFIAGYSDDITAAYQNLPAIVFGDHTRVLKFANFPFLLGADGAKILQPTTDKLDCKYLFYYLLQNPVPSTGYNRHFSWLKRMSVVYPVSLDEQRHIAEILTTCDEVIEKSEAVVEKYRAIKAGMLKDLFTRGIGKNGKLRPPPESAPQLYKDTALGKVPREWEIKNLGEIGRFVAGNGFPLQYQGRKDGQYPFFKVSDFNGWANTNVMSIANHYVSDDVVRILGCNVIPARSIVFAKIGAAIMLERKRMVAVASCIDNNMMSLQVDGANDSLVLHFLQNYKFSDLVEATALPALKTTSLKKICLAIPSDPAEQHQIAERLSAIDAKIVDELAVIAKYRKVKAGLMARLLTPPDGEVE